jgi:succinate dehydrogenase/fumarate reductase cytochrome b subunit
MQQSIYLARIGSHEKGLVKIRKLFMDNTVIEEGQTMYHLSNSMLFALQSPAMLLGTSLALFFLGLMIIVYDAAQSAGCWGDDVKIAICFTVSFLYAFGSYFMAWHHIVWGLRKFSEDFM